METRIRQSKEALWVTGGFFLGMVILTSFVHFRDDWWLPVFWGILFVVELIHYYTQKDNDLVIDDRGIHQVKGIDYKWYQINHCYCESRLKGSYDRYSGPYRSSYLIIVLNGGKRVSIPLRSYDLRKKDIMGIIQETSRKDIGYRDDVDISFEKDIERKKFKSMWLGSIIFAIIFFICMLLWSAIR